MTGVVLAGGKNIRMGRNKATLPWQQADFLHVILHRLSGVCSELIVVTNTPLSIQLPNVLAVSDIIPQCGPLSGIHAGLTYASSPTAFVTACDMPYLQPAAVAWVAQALANGMRWRRTTAIFGNPCSPAMPKPAFQSSNAYWRKEFEKPKPYLTISAINPYRSTNCADSTPHCACCRTSTHRKTMNGRCRIWTRHL